VNASANKKPRRRGRRGKTNPAQVSMNRVNTRSGREAGSAMHSNELDTATPIEFRVAAEKIAL
jgi:hypothetical protein